MTHPLVSADQGKSAIWNRLAKLVWSADYAAEWTRRRHIRIALASLSADELQDIGLIPDDLNQVLEMPLSHDANQVLRDIAATRSCNW